MFGVIIIVVWWFVEGLFSLLPIWFVCLHIVCLGGWLFVVWSVELIICCLLLSLVVGCLVICLVGCCRCMLL